MQRCEIFSHKNRAACNRLGMTYRLALALSAGSCFAVLLFLLLWLLKASFPFFLETGGRGFLMQSVWEPQNGKFGIWPQLLSTLVLALFSAATAAFVGAGSVCFLRFFCTRQAARLILKGAALLSGLPSVLYGMIGMLFVVPKLGAKFPQAGESGGACLLAGWIVLSAMLISPMTLACADAADAADVRVIRASDALGATKTQTAFCCMLPLIRTARRAAFGQAFCRAAGEATAVLLVCGNVVRLPLPFSPVRTLSGTVVLEMGYAFGMHRSALFAIGLVLLAVSLLFPAKREPS